MSKGLRAIEEKKFFALGARMLENNPVLMRLKELELLEKISSRIELKVMLGDKGLTDKIVNLL